MTDMLKYLKYKDLIRDFVDKIPEDRFDCFAEGVFTTLTIEEVRILGGPEIADGIVSTPENSNGHRSGGDANNFWYRYDPTTQTVQFENRHLTDRKIMAEVQHIYKTYGSGSPKDLLRRITNLLGITDPEPEPKRPMDKFSKSQRATQGRPLSGKPMREEWDAKQQATREFSKALLEVDALERVKRLIISGLNVNSRVVDPLSNRSLLSIACGCGRVDVVKALLNAGADPNRTDDDGKSPFVVAAANGRAEVVRTFLSVGDAQSQGDKGLNAALYWLVSGWLNLNEDSQEARYVETMEILIGAGADPNVMNNASTSPLLYATSKGATRIVVQLIRVGADPNLRDREGQTALMLAAQRGDSGTVEALIRAGVATDIKNQKGLTALDLAKNSKCMILIRGALSGGNCAPEK